MLRLPISLSRLVKVTREGTVLYKAEKPDCRAFPLLAGDGMRPGAKRNYEVLSPLDSLAEFTQHPPSPPATAWQAFQVWLVRRSSKSEGG